jgi:uncharacterized protein YbjT (DUF2867 family)
MPSIRHRWRRRSTGSRWPTTSSIRWRARISLPGTATRRGTSGRPPSATGSKRIIYLGGLQPLGSQSEHLASREETGDILRDGSIPVTELRAGIIVGAGSAAFEVIRDLALHLRVMVTPRWVRSRTQPIALDDLLAYLVGVLDVPATASRTFDVGGPETLSHQEMIRQFAGVMGSRVRILPVPVLTPRLSSHWLDLVTAVPANVARPLIEGLRHDLLGDDREMRALIPLPLRNHREAVARALDIERTEHVSARWTEGALLYRAGRPDFAYYSRRAGGTARCAAPPDVVWQVVARSAAGRAGPPTAGSGACADSTAWWAASAFGGHAGILLRSGSATLSTGGGVSP